MWILPQVANCALDTILRLIDCTPICHINYFEADAYAVAQTSGADLSTALLKLYEDNASTLTPDPLYVKFYYSHPPAFERLQRMAG